MVAQCRLVIEHWSGRSWRPVAVPGKALAAFGKGGVAFAVIGASSGSNVWSFNQLTGAWLHWNGHRWSEGLVSRLTGRSALAITSMLVLGPDDVWAFGGRVNGHGDAVPFAARFDGRRWKVTPMPRLLNLLVSAASAVSPREIWAVIGRGGQAVFPPGPSGGALAHWDGRRWQLMPLPARLARRVTDQYCRYVRPGYLGRPRHPKQQARADRDRGTLGRQELAGDVHLDVMGSVTTFSLHNGPPAHSGGR